MKRTIVLFLGIILLFCFNSCDIDSDENFQFVILEVVSATMPEVFNQNEPHSIEVVFRRPDTCTFFSNFDVESENTNARNIIAIGSLLTEADCTDTNDEVSALFEFTALEIGAYTFRFYAGNTADGEPEYIEYVVPVKPEGLN